MRHFLSGAAAAATAALLAGVDAAPRPKVSPAMAVVEIESLMGRAALDVTCPTWPSFSHPDPLDFYLRILPLGASIVWGYGSTTGNGFRKPLRDTLRQDGWKVNMVGSKNNGDMIDSNVEAHPGDRIDQIHTASGLSTKYQPNVIVINAGTNDCLQSFDLANVGDRYGSFLDDLFNAIPNVTIVASTVLVGLADGIPQNRDTVNNAIKSVVADRRSKGQKVVLTDTDVPAGFFTTDYLVSDGIHPTDEGHRRLAAMMRRGIYDAQTAGFLAAPTETAWSDEDGASGGGDNTCDKTYGSGESNGPVNTQAGSGLDDGGYVHDSESMGAVLTVPATNGANFTFARVKRPWGTHDLLQIMDDLTADGSGRVYRLWTNDGKGGFADDYVKVSIPDTCIARGVRFADINADGLDDMICIAVDGTAYAATNNGDSTWTSQGKWKDSEAVQDRVLLADIDGDGRVDYCTIADNGDISCWRNGGQGDMPEYWQALGIMFTGKNFGDVAGVRFSDLNGDGRDDWMWVSNTGETWTYTNNRGCDKGSLEPLWRFGSNLHDGEGHTHAGMGTDVGRETIFFANIYDEVESIGLYGRRDYVYMSSQVQSTGGTSSYVFNIWKNLGSGATKLKGDGDRYCNMMGRENGAMDYIWVHSTGYMILYESWGGEFPSDPPYWGPNSQIWAATDYVGKEIDRRDLHLADWDGDGLCDILYVDPTKNSVRVWTNPYKKNGNFDTWTEATAPSIGTLCDEHRGVGIYDLAVRFADIDGNGKADYLCMQPDGRTWGYLNNDDGLQYIEQFKYSEGKDRANHRFADVNGDGRADFLWVDKFVGDTTVWYNRGEIEASGSAFTWESEGVAYEGAMQGSCLHWPDLDGDGRADMQAVDALTNTAQAWFNRCPGETGSSTNGDDSDTLTTTPVTWLGL